MSKIKHTQAKTHVPSLPEIDLQESSAIIIKTPDMYLHISVQEGGLCIKDIENCSTQFLIEPVLSNSIKIWTHKIEFKIEQFTL